jgi:hypothetical protein
VHITGGENLILLDVGKTHKGRATKLGWYQLLRLGLYQLLRLGLYQLSSLGLYEKVLRLSRACARLMNILMAVRKDLLEYYMP